MTTMMLMHSEFLQASILHTFNPFILKLFFIREDFGIRWYGMAYLTGFIAGYLIIRFLATRGRASMKPELVADFITYAAIGTMVGGRLGYCIFYQPELFVQFRSSPPFWDALAVHEGGMASHGGMIGIAVACLLFARKYKLNPLHLFDLTTLGGTIGIFCGRIANFLNGELVGRPAPANLPWAVKFPQDMYLWPDQEPQRLATLKDAVAKIGISPDQWQSWLQSMNFDVHAREAIRSTIHTLIDAIQNGQAQVAHAIEPLLTPRHPSQLYEAGLEGLFLFTVLFLTWYKPRKPGVISGIFVSLYAVVRIFGEQFRMPDVQLGFRALGLTRGQWLSIAMLAFGLTILWIWSRRKVPAIGGWGGRKN